MALSFVGNDFWQKLADLRKDLEAIEDTNKVVLNKNGEEKIFKTNVSISRLAKPFKIKFYFKKQKACVGIANALMVISPS